MQISTIGYLDAVLAEGEQEENLVERHFIGDMEIRLVHDYQGTGKAVTVISGGSSYGVLIAPS